MQGSDYEDVIQRLADQECEVLGLQKKLSTEKISSLVLELGRVREDVGLLQGHVKELRTSLKALDGRVTSFHMATDRGVSDLASRLAEMSASVVSQSMPSSSTMLQSTPLLVGHSTEERSSIRPREQKLGLRECSQTPLGTGMAADARWLQASHGKDTYQVLERLLVVEKESKRDLALMALDVKATFGGLQEQLVESISAAELRHAQLRESLEKCRATQESQRAAQLDSLQLTARDLRVAIASVQQDSEAQRCILEHQWRKQALELRDATDQSLQDHQRAIMDRLLHLDTEWRKDAESRAQKQAADLLSTKEALKQLQAEVSLHKEISTGQQLEAWQKGTGQKGTRPDPKDGHDLTQELQLIRERHHSSQPALREELSVNEADLQQKLSMLSRDQHSVKQELEEIINCVQLFKVDVAKEVSNVMNELKHVRIDAKKAVLDERGFTQAVLQHLVAQLQSEMRASTSKLLEAGLSASAPCSPSRSPSKLQSAVTARFRALEQRLEEVEVEVNVCGVVDDLVRKQDNQMSSTVWTAVVNVLRESLEACAQEQQHCRDELEQRLDEHSKQLQKEMRRFEAFLENAGLPAREHLAALEAEMRHRFANSSQDGCSAVHALGDGSLQTSSSGNIAHPRLDASQSDTASQQLCDLQASHGELQLSFRDVQMQFTEKFGKLDQEVRAIIERVLELRDKDQRLLHEELSRQRADSKAQHARVATTCQRVQALKQEVAEVRTTLQSIIPVEEAAFAVARQDLGMDAEDNCSLHESARGLFQQLETFELDLSGALSELEGSMLQQNIAPGAPVEAGDLREADALLQQFTCLRDEMRDEMANAVQAATANTSLNGASPEASWLLP
mmetsp:Transcript_41935/g.98358  ORF Transcript_41935/g.98358 Transcript_41935/m.98358 type:complete len:852 (-) Transcript_41935:74-2629(-)